MNNIVAVRLSKTVLVAGAAFFSTLVVFNNLVDYQSNYLYVMHVMTMDTTGNAIQAEWRAIHEPLIWQLAYFVIIAVEVVIAMLCWVAAARMICQLKSPLFSHAKVPAILGLTLGVLLWFLAFMAISGEWFLAWQSPIWNGIQPGFRIASLLFMTLIYVSMSEQ
ncbi:DUF2165 family protein [Endozoicomonadaceae bacterium StTr2]